MAAILKNPPPPLPAATDPIQILSNLYESPKNDCVGGYAIPSIDVASFMLLS